MSLERKVTQCPVSRALQGRHCRGMPRVSLAFTIHWTRFFHTLLHHTLSPIPLHDNMDVDPSSSPPMRHTSLPPSSGPMPSLPSNSDSTPPRRTPTRSAGNALSLGDDDVADTANGDGPARRRRKPKANAQINVDVPIVRDAVGESVRENFEAFLKT